MLTLKQFEDETCILPHIVAQAIGAEDEYIPYLVGRLLTICSHNATFYKQCKAGNRGRDHVYAFMEHWYLAVKKTGITLNISGEYESVKL